MAFKKLKENYELYKSHYFAGNELYCPFCSRFFRMDTFGRSGGKSTHCPVCASSKEERTLLLFLQSRTQLLTGELRILVISEKNEITKYFSGFPNTDIKIFTLTGDFSIRNEELRDKYPSDHFDVIICNYVLEKMPSYYTLMEELKRIIKTNGFITLQANIDSERETTLETHHQMYKDRLKIYGVWGNYRRFGRDYVQVLNENGLSVLEYDFVLNLSDIPEETFFKKYRFYLGYKDDAPIIKNYDTVVDDAIDEHYNSSKEKSIFYSMIYMFFFLIPDIIRIKVNNLGNKISEKQKNKHRTEYMLFILITGLFLFWSTLALFIWTGHFYSSYFIGGIIHWFIAFPIFLTVGLGGLSILYGYAFVTNPAGEIKKGIVGMFFSASLFLSIIILMFGQ
ncbi:MAG: methyltransferase domain-containing protein [Candidatus Delongbacteria bacterium]|jgi:SAM-dependent methyltransferase|nr:methyltransferase domain-containing protein [Candidatus Delongbacteria bacterium]